MTSGKGGHEMFLLHGYIGLVVIFILVCIVGQLARKVF